MSASISGIKVKIGGDEKTLSLEEARALHGALDAIFAKPQGYPVYISYERTTPTPAYPWHQQPLIAWEYTANRPTITC